jgi:hypothetical protein
MEESYEPARFLANLGAGHSRLRISGFETRAKLGGLRRSFVAHIRMPGFEPAAEMAALWSQNEDGYRIFPRVLHKRDNCPPFRA